MENASSPPTLIPQISQNIFYDVVPFGVTADIMSDLDDKVQKNQVIVFVILNMQHRPVVSFCYEDVCSVASNTAMEKCEIYEPGARIRRDNETIYIKSPGWGIDVALKLPDKQTVWELKCMKTNQLILKTIFNNFKYIEKTIIDTVEEHDAQLPQLIRQVKKITKHLAE